MNYINYGGTCISGKTLFHNSQSGKKKSILHLYTHDILSENNMDLKWKVIVLAK